MLITTPRDGQQTCGRVDTRPGRSALPPSRRRGAALGRRYRAASRARRRGTLGAPFRMWSSRHVQITDQVQISARGGGHGAGGRRGTAVRLARDTQRPVRAQPEPQEPEPAPESWEL